MTSATPALAALAAAHVAHTVLEYDHDPAVTTFGREAADKLGVEPERVFKTLVVDVDGRRRLSRVQVVGVHHRRGVIAVRVAPPLYQQSRPQLEVRTARPQADAAPERKPRRTRIRMPMVAPTEVTM